MKLLGDHRVFRVGTHDIGDAMLANMAVFNWYLRALSINIFIACSTDNLWTFTPQHRRHQLISLLLQAQ
jgi:hypothetical protein